MTEEPAAITAGFYTWRPAMRAKMLQLVFEVPMKDQERVLKYLGAPDSENPPRVAIALLARPESEVIPIAKARKRPETEGEKAVMRAGILCKDTEFQFWAAHLEDYPGQTIEDFVRDYCGIQSRSELAANEGALQRFYQLEANFREWAARR
jgi:hypothetical protein